MEILDVAESASLIAIAVLVTIPLVAHALGYKDFAYPALIAFCAGYVAGSVAVASLGWSGFGEDFARLLIAGTAMQVVRVVGRARTGGA